MKKDFHKRVYSYTNVSNFVFYKYMYRSIFENIFFRLFVNKRGVKGKTKRSKHTAGSRMRE